MSDLQWGINGVMLPSVRGEMFSTEATVWRVPSITPDRRALVVAGQHGSLEFGSPVFSEPTVTIVARFRYRTMAELEQAVGWFNSLAMAPSVTLSRLSAGVTATAGARLVSISHDEFVWSNEFVTAKVTVVYAIPRVFFSEVKTTSDDLDFSADLNNSEIASLSGSTAPVVGAVVRLTGPLTAVLVTDPLSASGISWAGTLAAGQYLFLDTADLTARISANAGDWLSGGSNVTSGLDYPAAGPLQLWPIADDTIGAQKIRLSATGAGRSAATKLAVRAGKSHS